MQLEKSVLDNGVIFLQLTGRLDIQGAGEIETAFSTHTTVEKSAVLVDLSAVEFIASIGIRLLLVNAKSVNSHGGKMGLLSPTPMVREALEISGIDTLITLYDDLDTASVALKSAVS